MTKLYPKAIISLVVIVGSLLFLASMYAPLWFEHFLFYDFTCYHYALSRIVAGDYPWDLSLAPKGIFYTWNPPFSLGFLLPFGFLKLETSQVVYAFFFAGILSYYLNSGLTLVSERRLGALSAFCFLFVALPYGAILSAFQTGSGSLFSLLGLTLFMRFREKAHLFLSGLGLSLTFIKPHLVTIPILLIVFHSIGRREFRIMTGLVLGLTISTGAVLFFRPSIVEDYLLFHRSTDIDFVTTGSLPHAIRWYLQVPTFVSSCVLLMATLSAFYFLLNRIPKSEHFLFTLVILSIPFSLFFGPYTWGHDFLLTCPTLLIILRYLLSTPPPLSSSAITVWTLLIFANGVTLCMVTGFYRLAGPQTFVAPNAALTIAAAFVVFDEWRKESKSSSTS